MYKLYRSVIKEMLLIVRDIGGLVILFLMPLVLVVVITLVQDGAYRNITEQKIALIVVDNDKGEIAQMIQKQMTENHFFEIITTQNGQAIDEPTARNLVLKGDYLLAIVIPQGLSTDLQEKVQHNVEMIVNSFAGNDSISKHSEKIVSKEINLYFDPTIQISFKENIKTSIDKMIYQIENQFIYRTFEQYLLPEQKVELQNNSIISFQEINPKDIDSQIVPNSVQHNIPAWALFAIFFIVIPLSGNIVREKTQGTGLRLFTAPVSYGFILSAKILTYLIISTIQFGLMLLIGLYFFPLIDLPALEVTGKLTALLLVALSSALSAIGLGILLGTLCNTQEQSAPLGATLAVILAAIGGVWIPVFAMPSTMQVIAKISPMNWALQAFYDILLRNSSLWDLLPKIGLLLVFSTICLFISVLYEKNKKYL